MICGTVAVPEERSKVGSRNVGLSFAILRAHSRYPEPDPLVYLEGGPGGSAMKMLPMLETLFSPWRDRRDIVIYDQRSPASPAHRSIATRCCPKAWSTSSSRAARSLPPTG